MEAMLPLGLEVRLQAVVEQLGLGLAGVQVEALVDQLGLGLAEGQQEVPAELGFGLASAWPGVRQLWVFAAAQLCLGLQVFSQQAVVKAVVLDLGQFPLQ